MTDTWKQLARTAEGPDGRLHLTRGDMPACGIAIKAGQGFVGAWAETRSPNAKTCKKCRRLAK